MKYIAKTCLITWWILFAITRSYGQEHLSNHSEGKIKMDENQQSKNQVCFIDKFFVPKNSIQEFAEKMNYNRDFVKKLSGLVKSDAYEQKDEKGNWIIITIAVWSNQDYLNNAKIAVQSEFKRINFNPTEFYQRLNIKMERGVYSKFEE